jgi:hypothetical protein
MHVWIFQHTEAGLALASGDSREQPAVKSEPDRWRVRTGLDPGSERFLPDTPAVAMAMALVGRDDGSTEVQQWSQAVFISFERDDRAD